MWETLQNDHDTNSEIERDRWWEDLFIVTLLRTNEEDIGTRVNHPDDFSKLRNKYITDSIFFSFLFYNRIFKHLVNLNTAQGNYYSVEQMM